MEGHVEFTWSWISLSRGEATRRCRQARRARRCSGAVDAAVAQRLSDASIMAGRRAAHERQANASADQAQCASAHFTGIGLGSTKRCGAAAAAVVAVARRASRRPPAPPRTSRASARGATLAVTMTPWPPSSISASAVSSSPLNRREVVRAPAASAARPRSMFAGRFLDADDVRHLRPAAATVSFCRSATVRPGTL